MKTKISLIVLCLTILGYAQQAINYKALIKDNTGNLVANQMVNMRLTILEGTIEVYQETHLQTTDNNGIVILDIGEGSIISGTFTTVNWANGNQSLRVEIDITGGNTFVDMGTTEFRAVPYALTSDTIKLPYFGSASQANDAVFHSNNSSTDLSYGIVGSTGSNGESLPVNSSGVLGYSTNGHGIYGHSENSSFAGVQGVSNSNNGYGVLGYGSGIGGHFYTTPTGQAALTTGNGNVGIGTQEPEEKLHVAGNTFIQTNLGALLMGFPNNGNLWRMSTSGAGADLLFSSKPSGSNGFNTRFRMNQNGEFQIGNIDTPSAWSHVKTNSSIDKPHLKLEEDGNDFARLELTNSASSGTYWQIAGLPSFTRANSRLDFFVNSGIGAQDVITFTGDRNVGINGTPTARLELFQRGQSVGTGLRFDDGTANQHWDITHGFSLRFHYGGDLRGFINANTGAYTQSSDASLKSNIKDLSPILERVEQLRPKSYFYNNDPSRTETIGLVAQEVAAIFPEVVHYSEADALYGIDYAAFGVIAIKAIQEQQEIIEKQQKQIDELKALVIDKYNKD